MDSDDGAFTLLYQCLAFVAVCLYLKKILAKVCPLQVSMKKTDKDHLDWLQLFRDLPRDMEHLTVSTLLVSHHQIHSSLFLLPSCHLIHSLMLLTHPNNAKIQEEK